MIFAGGLLLLLAIAALVIDLGFVFMLRRYEQNVADPAAIAAARYIRPVANEAKMTETACFYARQNGLFPNATDNTGCVPANDPLGTVLTVNFPPSVAAGQFAGRPGFVEVVIGRPHQTFFGRVLGIQQIQVTTSAVAAFTDGDSNSTSLLALDPTAQCSTGEVSGTNTVVKIVPTLDPSTGEPYDGGYVHVNSSCGAPPMQNGDCGSGEGNTALRVNGNGASLEAPHVYVHGTCSTSGGAMNSPLNEGAVQIGDPLADLQPPLISDYPAGRCGPTGSLTGPTGNARKGCNFPSGETMLSPGVYYGGWTISQNVKLKLSPGVYIIAGGGITTSGTTGSIESVSGDPTVDARILIFSTDNPAKPCGSQDQFEKQGPLNFTASSTFRAKALDAGPWKGILIWQDGDGCNPSAAVSLGGGSNVEIAGTIYAPEAPVTLNGGSSGTGIASVQIIAKSWKIAGGATLTMPYDPKELYQFEQKGLVR